MDVGPITMLLEKYICHIGLDILRLCLHKIIVLPLLSVCLQGLAWSSLSYGGWFKVQTVLEVVKDNHTFSVWCYNLSQLICSSKTLQTTYFLYHLVNIKIYIQFVFNDRK
ncbi:hypothetical protein L6164_034495 [Bauhinia variegata]|uniref:Uncharacterized protein n=1 Tax=Bauhinia variegata TaxID=167791 RepID=A0ACB9KV36_BAUVA|nr:hypothetical protein L6164_034495 [Bauhinia variegata]